MQEIFKAACKGKTFQPLLTELYRIQQNLDETYRAIRNNFQDGLAELLCRLQDESDNLALNSKEAMTKFNEVCVDLRNIKPGVALRFCGRFYNMAYVRTSNGRKEICLAYGLTEDEEIPEERFATDVYTGEQAIHNEINFDSADIWNVMNLAGQLTVYFQETGLFRSYCQIKNELIESIEAVDRKPYNDLLYYINVFFVNLGKTHCQYSETDSDHYFMFPYGISVRCYGRYFNCLITRADKTSLGYLRRNTGYLCEEIYGDDGYTCRKGGETRWYTLLHRLEIDGSMHEDHLYRGLAALSMLFAESSDIDDFDYIAEDDVTERGRRFY